MQDKMKLLYLNSEVLGYILSLASFEATLNCIAFIKKLEFLKCSNIPATGMLLEAVRLIIICQPG